MRQYFLLAPSVTCPFVKLFELLYTKKTEIIPFVFGPFLGCLPKNLFRAVSLAYSSGFVPAAATAWFKEYLDYRKRGYFDFYDLGYGVAGALTALIAWLAIVSGF